MKILYGICGIGNGHLFRQLPILNQLIKRGHEVTIFGYGASFAYCQKMPHVHTFKVAVPYYKGCSAGLDFEASIALNQENVFPINCEAMAKAHRVMGRPDLVISDYEPVAAQYAYAWDAPLVTIDQQSKYMMGSFPPILGGQHYVDEVMRLRMFFPKAAARIACSFFDVPRLDMEEGYLAAPPLREELAQLGRKAKKNCLLVYVSIQNTSPMDWITLFKMFPSMEFHVFLPQGSLEIDENVTTYPHGHGNFNHLLTTCSGLISNAGHSLLSEAMHLGIPVLALPLPLYEQQMNAHVIDANTFGISTAELNKDVLTHFIDSLNTFSHAIATDQKVLLKHNGTERILSILERFG